MTAIKPQGFNAAAECCLWLRKNGRIPMGFRRGETIVEGFSEGIDREGRAVQTLMRRLIPLHCALY